MGDIHYTEELDALFDDYLKTDPDVQKWIRMFVEERKQNKKEEIMSWSVSAEATKDSAVDQIGKLEPAYEIGEGAKYQLIKAKEYAIEAICSETVRGEKFGITLSGHSQADSPGSAPDSISISVYART